MQFESHFSLREIKEEWDSFLPSSHHLQSKEIEFLEHSDIHGVQFIYLLIRAQQRGALEAVAYFQLIHFKADHYQSIFNDTFLLGSIEKRIMKNGFRILCCGNLLRVDAPGLCFKEKMNVPELFAVLEKFYREEKLKADVIWMKDWQNEWSNDHFRRFSFVDWGNDMSMKIMISSSWKSMKDYENALRHHYAQRLRKARIKKKELDVQALSEKQIEFLNAEIYGLYRNVVNKQPIRLIIAGKNYFIQLKKNFGEDCMFLGYYHEKKLVGFSSMIMKKNFEEMHLIGFDYYINEKTWLYFNMMFDALEMAIQYKKSWMELGRTARQPKAAMGAQPVFFKNYIRVSNPGIRFLIALLRRMFNQTMESEWQTIQAFRQIP